MDTPKRMSLAESQARIAHFLSFRCRRNELNQVSCAHCGGEIRRVRAYLSLHDLRFGDACIGPPRAWRMEIPYCAVCEDTPSLYGCIHMSEEDIARPSVVEASRPFGREHPEYAKQFPPVTLEGGSLGTAQNPPEKQSQDGQHDRVTEQANPTIHAKAREDRGSQ